MAEMGNLCTHSRAFIPIDLKREVMTQIDSAIIKALMLTWKEHAIWTYFENECNVTYNKSSSELIMQSDVLSVSASSSKK